MITSVDHKSNTFFFLLSTVLLAAIVAAITSGYYWIAALPFGLLFFYAGWQSLSLFFYLLILSIPWSIEYNFSNTLGTDIPDEPLMWFVMILLIVNWVGTPQKITASLKHPLLFFLLLHMGWVLATVFFSTNSLVSVKFLLAKTWYLAAFVFTPIFLLRDKKTIAVTGVCFFLSMIAFTVFANYRHYNLGFTFANINDALQPFFRNHVNYSAMLVCTVPVMVAIYQLHKRSRIFIEIFFLFVMAALFLSYARGAWLALVLGTATYWLMIKKKFFQVYIVSFALLLAAAIWVKSNDRYMAYAHDFRTTIFHKNFSEHLAATYELKDVSTAERFNRWVAGVKMIDDNWLTGYGPNTFYENYKPYMIPAFKTWVSANEDHSTVHNYFLLTTIEQGIPGLLFFLILLGAMVWYAQHLYHRTHDKFYKTVTMCISVLLVMITTVNMLSDLIETDKVGSLFFLCLGLLIVIDRNSKVLNSDKNAEVSDTTEAK